MPKAQPGWTRNREEVAEQHSCSSPAPRGFLLLQLSAARLPQLCASSPPPSPLPLRLTSFLLCFLLFSSLFLSSLLCPPFSYVFLSSMPSPWTLSPLISSSSQALNTNVYTIPHLYLQPRPLPWTPNLSISNTTHRNTGPGFSPPNGSCPALHPQHRPDLPHPSKLYHPVSHLRQKLEVILYSFLSVPHPLPTVQSKF